MSYPATNFNEAVQLVVPDSNAFHDIINGTALEEVTLPEGDTVPTVRKALADSLAFKSQVEDWSEGDNQTDYLVLRKFDDQLYWAPLATASNPVPMGVTPIGDSNWVIALVNNTLQTIAALNSVSIADVAYLEAQTLTGQSYFYDQASQKTYISSAPLSGVLTVIDGEDFKGDVTLTVGATEYSITRADFYELRKKGDASGWGLSTSNVAEINDQCLAAATSDAATLKRSLIIPDGDFYFSQKIPTVSIVALSARSPRLTRLIWDENATSAGLDVQYVGGQMYGVTISGIGFYRSSAFGETAISVKPVDGGASYPDIARGSISNCVFEGLEREIDTAAWAVDIYTSNVAGIDIEYCIASGIELTDQTSQAYDGVFLWQDDDNTEAEVASHHWVRACQATRKNIAAIVTSAEGLYFDECRFFNVDYGVDYTKGNHTTNFAPRFTWRGGHIAATKRAMRATGAASTLVTGCNMLFNRVSDPYGYKHMEFIDCSDGLIHSNIIASTSASFPCDGVTLNNTTDFLIDGNDFGTYGGYALVNINSRYNKFSSSNKLRYGWAGIVSNDADSYCSVSHGINKYRFAGVAVPAATDTVLSVSDIYEENLGNDTWWTLGNDITVPLPASRARYKIHVELIYSSTVPGDRIEIDVLINGANAIGSGKVYGLVTKGNGTTETLQLDSDNIVINGNSTISLNVYSVSGVTVNANSTISIEYLGDA